MTLDRIQPRWYQTESVSAIFDYFESNEGNPIVALPTGTGKSIVIADFTKKVMTNFPGQRILMLTHVKELIRQNYDELVELWPLAPVGIYSAGLKRKEIRPITFAGIASVASKAALFGHVDLVLIDECHLVSPNDETRYRNFIADLEKVNPSVKVIGLTATPYRLGQGLLTEPVETKSKMLPPLFTDICYDKTRLDDFNRFIDEGFLVPLVPKRTDLKRDLSGVGKVGGEFNLEDLQAAVDKTAITRKAIDEMIAQGFGTRRKWLVFASGVDHAEHIAEELKSRGFDAVAVSNRSPDSFRDQVVKWFKQPAELEAPKIVVNKGVFDCALTS